MEKQMGGCMAGFFNIFDRQQNFTGKRNFATKRLPPPPPQQSQSVESSPGPEKTSPDVSEDADEQKQTRSPAPEPGTPVSETPTRSPLPLPLFELKEGTPRSPWRFSKEAPRLSLDSRAVVDARGGFKQREMRNNGVVFSAESGADDGVAAEEKQRRSPSVVARLMGLDKLPSSDSDPTQQVELRRSASESRVNRDRYGFIEGLQFQSQQQQNPRSFSPNTVVRDQKMTRTDKNNNGLNENGRGMRRTADPWEVSVRGTARATPNRGTVVQRKNFFDSSDFFPEPAKKNAPIFGEMEKRLKMRGIDEPSKDLEALKQILESLQLKGLLHSNRPQSSNLVYEESYESPIVVVRPARSVLNRPNRGGAGRAGDASPSYGFRSRSGSQQSAGETYQDLNPRLERSATDRRRNASSPTRSECGAKSPAKSRSSTGDTRRRVTEPRQQRRVSPVHSPKAGTRRTGPVQNGLNRSRMKVNPTVEILAEDESSTVSESSLSTSSPTDTERDYKDGRNLLERCGKLLNSIAEMTALSTGTELQPSPVSVLDSSFYKEASPSPIFKRSIDFRDQLEEDMCSSEISSAESKSEEKSPEECEFAYVCEIIRASTNLPVRSDVFSFLEKQQYLIGKDTSKTSRLERKLTFDTIGEILDRKKRLPPWISGEVSIQQVWLEFQRIKVRDETEDLFEAICGVLRKDLADGDEGWGGCHVEVSQTVLDIERLVFKDLIGETIGDLAALAGTTCMSRRRLVF